MEWYIRAPEEDVQYIDQALGELWERADSQPIGE